jgi:hypothetical protein
MFSSNSTEMEDQIVMAFFGIMDEDISILRAEEATVVAASSSTWLPLVTYEAPTSLTTILQREAHLTSGLIFLNLQSDLIEHVWNKFH